MFRLVQFGNPFLYPGQPSRDPPCHAYLLSVLCSLSIATFLGYNTTMATEPLSQLAELPRDSTHSQSSDAPPYTNRATSLTFLACPKAMDNLAWPTVPVQRACFVILSRRTLEKGSVLSLEQENFMVLWSILLGFMQSFAKCPLVFNSSVLNHVESDLSWVGGSNESTVPVRAAVAMTCKQLNVVLSERMLWNVTVAQAIVLDQLYLGPCLYCLWCSLRTSREGFQSHIFRCSLLNGFFIPQTNLFAQMSVDTKPHIASNKLLHTNSRGYTVL